MSGFNTEGVMPVMPYGNSNDGFGFGAGGGWIVFLIIAMMFGWGRNGFGGFGNGAGGFVAGETMADQFALQDLKNGQRQIDSGIRGIERGICDSTYAMAQQGSQTREMLGFGLRDLQSDLADCCCTTNRNIDSVKYEMSKGFCDVVTAGNLNTRDIIASQERGTQRIIDLMTQNTIQDLRDQNQALALSAALQQQTTNITNITNPRVIPSYPVCSPYEALYNGGCGRFNGNCGCN